MTVGEILRRARLHYGQSVQDIERALRIRGVQIEAIENGRYEHLPGQVYIVGFIRSYSEYLGLDGEKMIGLYKSQTGRRTERPELHFPEAPPETRSYNIWMIAGSAVAVLIVTIGWWIMTATDRSVVQNVPPVPEAMKMPTPSSISAEPAGPAVPEAIKAALDAKPAPAEKGIILVIVENSWVEIKDAEGKTLVSRVLQKGDRYFVPDRPDLTMSLGNSAGVQVEINGRKLAPLGRRGVVLRNLTLDAAELMKRYAPMENAQ